VEYNGYKGGELIMKKIIVGVIIGFIISFSVQTFASEAITALRATFDVYVAGQKLNTDKPILSVNGSTYLPLRDIGSALGTEVKWNEELKRVEIGMGSNEVIATPRPTPTPTNYVKSAEDKLVIIQLLGARINNEVYSRTDDTMEFKIRVINKSTSNVTLSEKDFKGIYELQSPPNTEQWQWVQNRIYLNKGSNIFETKIEFVDLNLERMVPGEVREGVVKYKSWAYNKSWFGVKYNDKELVFTELHSF